MNGNAVEFRGVCKAYSGFQLSDVDLTLPEGQVMGFIGPNGAGKSTTIRILMGLVKADRGVLNVLGHKSQKSLVRAKEQIGYVSEDMRLYGAQTLEWHMGFVAKVYGCWSSSYAEDLCKRFDLRPEQKIKGMSHGQRVKSALLLALARFPKLLVLDEPTTGLDPVARQEVLAALTEVLLDEQRTILFSSHNTQDVEQLSDSITFIDRGHIIDSSDKDCFIDKWRRIRLEVPDGKTVPSLEGVKAVHQSGKLAVLTTSAYSVDTPQKFEQAGVKVSAVERMTLEEIFLTDVSASRERIAS